MDPINYNPSLVHHLDHLCDQLSMTQSTSTWKIWILNLRILIQQFPPMSCLEIFPWLISWMPKDWIIQCRSYWNTNRDLSDATKKIKLTMMKLENGPNAADDRSMWRKVRYLNCYLRSYTFLIKWSFKWTRGWLKLSALYTFCVTSLSWVTPLTQLYFNKPKRNILHLYVYCACNMRFKYWNCFFCCFNWDFTEVVAGLRSCLLQ